MQTLKTKHHGDITFLRTWVQSSLHIGRLAGGGYLHTSGLPIATEQEIREAIPKGPDLDDALQWFKHRDDIPVPVKRRIMIELDGSYVFDDGNPVQSITELVQCIPPGPALDAAVMWFSARASAANQLKADARATGQSNTKVPPKKAAPARKPPPRKAPVKLPAPVKAAPVVAEPQQAQAIVD